MTAEDQKPKLVGPLSGLKVLDFSTLLPGPLATLMLAEAGATVTKIERPGVGDDMRHFEPKKGDTSILFALLNRGKQSLALDLKNPADKARAFALAAEADILIDQFRPGVMARLGLSYEDIAKVNPRIVYCAITGYGQTGPKIDGAGHDLNYAAEAGLLSLVADSDGAPPLPYSTFADIAGGAYPAIINILLALRERDQTGRGRHLDIAMSDNMFPFLWRAQASIASGASPVANDDMLTGASPRYGLYRTRDGKFIAARADRGEVLGQFLYCSGFASYGQPNGGDAGDRPAGFGRLDESFRRQRRLLLGGNERRRGDDRPKGVGAQAVQADSDERGA